MKNYSILFILFTCCVQTLLFAQFNENRYRHAIFSQVDVQTDVQYGAAPQWVFPYWNEDLKLNVYKPTGDVVTNRPLIIFAHSGGFLNGSKDVDDMVAICDSFARKGYVTATIGYRKGFNPLDAESAERAVYRGVQDGKAAVRYFKEHASTYGIDTNFIYIGGMSAGGFIALHVAYMDLESERPASTYGGGTVNNLGCLDCAGNTYNHSSKVRAVLNYWGAIQDTINIVAGDVPILLMHGTDDPTVPFSYGQPFGLFTLPYVYGSELIHRRVNNLGIYNEFYTSSIPGLHMLDGSDNGTFTNPPNSFWYDTLLPRTTDFLVKMTKSNPTKYSPDTIHVCFGESVPLAINGTIGFHHKWILHNGSTSTVLSNITGTATSLVMPSSGHFRVSVVEFNEVYCASDTLWFDIFQEPEVELLAISDLNTTVCADEQVQLVVSENVGSTYVWTVNSDMLNETSATLNHQFTQGGTYQVEVFATSENGCVSNTIAFTVNQIPSLNPTTEMSDSLVLCNGEQTNLEVAGQPNSIFDWSVHVAGNVVPVQTTLNVLPIVFNQEGIYEVAVVEMNGTCLSDTLWFTVYQRPELVADFDYTIQNSSEVSFVNTSTNYSFVTWDFGDGSTSQVVNPNHSYDANGSYLVTLNLSDDFGCTNSTSQTINIEGLGIEVLDVNFVNIYPNPFSNIFQISNGGNERLLIEIIDLNGKVMLTSKAIEKGEILRIDVTNWSTGNYFVNVCNQQGDCESIKVSK